MTGPCRTGCTNFRVGESAHLIVAVARGWSQSSNSSILGTISIRCVASTLVSFPMSIPNRMVRMPIPCRYGQSIRDRPLRGLSGLSENRNTIKIPVRRF